VSRVVLLCSLSFALSFGAACSHSSTTSASAEAFGAAAFVPEDAACLLSLRAPAQLVRDVAGSGAFAELARLPFVRDALREWQQSAAMLQSVRQRQPLLDDLLAVLADAGDREVFASAGPELVPFGKALLACMQQAVFARLATGFTARGNGPAREREAARELLAAVAAQGDALHLPPVVLGLRLADTRRAESLVDRLADVARRLPGKVARVREGGTDYQVYELTADAFPGWRPQLQRALAQTGLPADQVAAFAQFVAGFRLTVAAGVRGDWLLFAVGHGADHLARLGGDAALAACSAFAPLRRRGGDGLMSLCWTCGALRDLGGMPVEQVLSIVDRALPAAPLAESRPDPGQRFKDDLRRFLTEISARKGGAVPYLSATFRNRGLETLRFGGGHSGGGGDAPLGIWAKAGQSPLLAVAWRSPSMKAEYERLAHWAPVFYGHFLALAVPRMAAGERADFARFAAVFGPAFAEFDATTREHLLPGVDGAEGLLVCDGWLEPAHWPRDPRPQSAPFRLPRPAFVLQVRDAEHWLAACRGYGAMLRGLCARLGADPRAAALPELPALQERRVAAGTLWVWPRPEPDLGIEPCMLVAGRTVVFALTPAHAEGLLARNWGASAGPAATGPVDVRAAAGAVGTVDLAGFRDWLQHDVAGVLRGAPGSGPADGDDIAAWLDTVLRAFAAVRRFEYRCHRDDGAEVEHGWLEVVDGR
jgi:hypothetical protein